MPCVALGQKYWFAGSELYDGKVLFRGKGWHGSNLIPLSMHRIRGFHRENNSPKK